MKVQYNDFTEVKGRVSQEVLKDTFPPRRYQNSHENDSNLSKNGTSSENLKWTVSENWPLFWAKKGFNRKFTSFYIEKTFSLKTGDIDIVTSDKIITALLKGGKFSVNSHGHYVINTVLPNLSI